MLKRSMSKDNNYHTQIEVQVLGTVHFRGQTPEVYLFLWMYQLVTKMKTALKGIIRVLKLKR